MLFVLLVDAPVEDIETLVQALVGLVDAAIQPADLLSYFLEIRMRVAPQILEILAQIGDAPVEFSGGLGRRGMGF